MRYRFMRFPGGKEKALTLSYDDGCLADRRLIEIANQCGIKVTLNINGCALGSQLDGWHLPAQEVKELAASGEHEIAIHGQEHIALGKATATNGIREVLLCREALEKAFGGVIRGMAYADTGITELTAGISYQEIRDYLQALGIAYGRTLGSDHCDFAMPQDFYAWMPTAKHTNPELMNWLQMFLDAQMPQWVAKRTPMLFYLWGHSFEFDRDGNWNLFQRFCQTAGGRDDIWYATNIEICDYTAAYHALQFSVDNTSVFNPTCMPVWFEADGKTVCAPAGELTKIAYL